MDLMLVVYHEHNGFLKEVLAFLDSLHVPYMTVEREKVHLSHYRGQEMVLVVGGDGTFLRASHLNKDIPMMGINPNPKRKEGFFMIMDNENYREALPKLLESHDTIRMLRLEVAVNRAILPEKALNEVYVGSEKPHAMFNYDIEIDGIREFQRSSGILIGTPAGSNAWLRSAGGSLMDLTSDKFQYIVREPYEGRITGKFAMKRGILDSSISIYPKTEGIIVIDSISRKRRIKIGDVIVISKGQPLRFIPKG
jgi:NAD+ kinase